MFRRVQVNELEKGDILLCRDYKVFTSREHAAIRLGQFLADLDTDATCHAALFWGYASTQKKVQVMEVAGSGVKLDYLYPSTEAQVYRYNGTTKGLAKEALKVAVDLSLSDDAKVYNGDGALGSLFKQSKVSSLENLSNLYKFKDKMDLDPVKLENSYFCSEFVVLCYQIAALRLRDAIPIERDACAMTPTRLHNYLKTHSNLWGKVGTYNAPTGGTLMRAIKRRLGTK